MSGGTALDQGTLRVILVLGSSLISKFSLKIAEFFAVFFHFDSKRCKGVHCVDLGERFPTSIYLQYLASIQPRTSLVKIVRSPCTDSI